MSRPVSIVVWFDAKTDPPTGDMERYVLFVDYECFVEMVTASDVVGACDLDARWAELPVLSDLTDDDVRDVADLAEGFLTRANIAPGSSAHEDVARLRAALGGEKEEGDA